MIRFATFLALCAVLGGCQSKLVREEIAPRAAQAIMTYCMQPQEVRLVVREQTNTLIAPNKVRIDCLGDTP